MQPQPPCSTARPSAALWWAWDGDARAKSPQSNCMLGFSTRHCFSFTAGLRAAHGLEGLTLLDEMAGASPLCLANCSPSCAHVQTTVNGRRAGGGGGRRERALPREHANTANFERAQTCAQGGRLSRSHLLEGADKVGRGACRLLRVLWHREKRAVAGRTGNARGLERSLTSLPGLPAAVDFVV